MEINSTILKTLDKYKIPRDDGICYLIAVYHGYTPSYIPDKLKQMVNATGLLQFTNTGLEWKVPLFEGGEVNFEWVKTEYEPMFKESNPKKGGHVKEAITRMKRFFAENPDVRKDEVMEATRMYILNTKSEYIRFPHYFIEKDKGVDKICDLLDWIQKYRLISQDTNDPNSSKFVKMQ